jgi:hypothetical protein
MGSAREKSWLCYETVRSSETNSLAADPLFSETAYKQLSSCLAQTIYSQENKLQIIFTRDNTLLTNSEFKFLIAMRRILWRE